ncbi:MAG: DMT family transporter [Mesorhizobium sp.]|nr:DMT family transporter [Mesorhizobium sp.]
MTPRGLLLFAALSILWGVPYLMIKIAVAEVSVPFLVFTRAAVGAVALLPFALADDSFRWLKARWLPASAFCLVEMVMPWGLIAHGEINIDSSTAGLLIALTPVVTVVASKLLGSGETLGLARWAGLFIGLAGVFVLALPTLGGGALGIGEILLAAVCYALGSIMAARWLGDVPTAPLTVFCLLGSALVYIVPAIQTWPDRIPSEAAILSIAALGVFCTALAFAAFFMLVREVGPERAVVITYVAPAIAVAAGVLVLSEPLDARILLAFALILSGSWLGTSSRRRRPSDA